MGYNVSYACFNTASFGPPQSRNRAWIIAGLNCDAQQAIRDADRFKCAALPLSSCIAVNKDLPCPARRPKPANTRNATDLKWHTDFDKECELLGGKDRDSLRKFRVEFTLLRLDKT